uniref:Uncharacterized protein n=1 Tax=Meloidogyne enterolobii TaxID=390850 RepID=A0A6V7YB12_MELEN|nr:unnamed protein product [Meloidogyne enterolobii]
MWLFLLFMCFSYLNAVLHGGGGTSTPSSNANGPEDSIRQNYPQYANMPFNDVHLQELFKTLPNYPIRTPTISVDVSRIEDWFLQNNPIVLI